MRPRPKAVILKADPDANWDEDVMEFRLTYEGLLLGASRTETRARHKQEIRKVLHRQIRRLWDIFPHLKEAFEDRQGTRVSWRDARAERFSRCGYRFIPLVTEELALLCGVHILFLRPDKPGELIKSGDIDNRLKTIFDALRMPSDKNELGGYDVPGPDEDPFYCLLQDDRLITQVGVETDILLESTGETFNVNDSRLVMTFKLRPAHMTWANIGFT